MNKQDNNLKAPRRRRTNNQLPKPIMDSGPIPPQPRPVAGRRLALNGTQVLKRIRGSAVDDAGVFQRLRRLMTPTAFSTYLAMMSPGENRLEAGYPDAESIRSVAQNKIVSTVSITRPAGFSGTSWSYIMLWWPSPELMASVLLYDGTLTAGSTIPWAVLGSEAVSGWQAQHIWWNDNTRVSDIPGMTAHGVYNLPYMGVEFVGTLDAAEYIYAATTTTNLNESVARTRQLAGSVTTTLNASALNNQGTAFSAQYPTPISSKTVATDLNVAHATTNATAPTLEIQNVAARGWILSGMPEKFEGLFEQDHYKGQAYDGNYLIQRWVDHPTFGATLGDRALVALELPAPSRNNQSIIIVPTAFQDINSPDDSTHANLAVPIAVIMDPSRLVSIQAFTGLSAASDVSTVTKVVSGFENVPQQGGPLTYYAEKPPAYERNFLDIVEVSSQYIPPGAIAAANDFMSVLKDIGSVLWEGVKIAVPQLIRGLLMAV